MVCSRGQSLLNQILSVWLFRLLLLVMLYAPKDVAADAHNASARLHQQHLVHMAAATSCTPGDIRASTRAAANLRCLDCDKTTIPGRLNTKSCHEAQQVHLNQVQPSHHTQ